MGSLEDRAAAARDKAIRLGRYWAKEMRRSAETFAGRGESGIATGNRKVAEAIEGLLALLAFPGGAAEPVAMTEAEAKEIAGAVLDGVYGKGYHATLDAVAGMLRRASPGGRTRCETCGGSGEVCWCGSGNKDHRHLHVWERMNPCPACAPAAEGAPARPPTDIEYG